MPTIRTWTDCSYLAAFVEGEGNFAIGVGHDPRTIAKSPSYKPMIRVTNTDREIIDYLHTAFGGSLREHTAPSKPSDSKRSWRLTWTGKDNLLKLISWMYPFLRGAKRESAGLFIDFFSDDLGRVKGGWRLKPEEIERREGIRQQIMIINQQGER